MKNVVILSDSHNNYHWTEEFLVVLDECDYIIHLGDGLDEINFLQSLYKDKFYYVLGNCDAISQSKHEFLKINIENVSLMLAHGHTFGVKYSLVDYAQFCLENDVAIGLFGHTHTPLIEKNGRLTLVNPGSMAYTYSYCYMTICGNKAFQRIVVC
ncbi:MAG: YfcE family phosphodiesterase [Clostridia bacterium]